MILRLILILCFLRLLLIAESNIDYYNILFYLIVYLSIREYIFYLKNKKENNPDKIVEGFFNYSLFNDMLDKFDASKVDEILVLLLSAIAGVEWVYKLFNSFFTGDDFTKNIQGVRQNVKDINISDIQKQFRDSESLKARNPL